MNTKEVKKQTPSILKKYFPQGNEEYLMLTASVSEVPLARIIVLNDNLVERKDLWGELGKKLGQISDFTFEFGIFDKNICKVILASDMIQGYEDFSFIDVKNATDFKKAIQSIKADYEEAQQIVAEQLAGGAEQNQNLLQNKVPLSAKALELNDNAGIVTFSESDYKNNTDMQYQ